MIPAPVSQDERPSLCPCSSSQTGVGLTSCPRSSTTENRENNQKINISCGFAFKRSYKMCKNCTTLQTHKHKPFYGSNSMMLSHSNRVSLQFFHFIYYPAITHFIGELATKVCGPSIDKGINKVSFFSVSFLSCSKGYFHQKNNFLYAVLKLINRIVIKSLCETQCDSQVEKTY